MMYKFLLISILLILTIRINISEGLFRCKRLGESCRRTIFHHCCGHATCELNGNKGICVPCLPVGRSCWRNKDCCSGRCHRFKCKKFKNPFINSILQNQF
ncbi:unnamed protein product [Schistosoma rodhaini]|nr:unnamed protein product [Schistosoma rodhaini]